MGSDITIYRDFEVHDHNKWGTHILRGPPQTFVLPLSRMMTSNTNSPALLSSSPFLPVCLMQTTLFFVILFFSYIVTSFVVTCVNKATVITLLC